MQTNFAHHGASLPVRAELRLTQGALQVVMNTMEFRDYKRFISGDRHPATSPQRFPRPHPLLA
jgi:hypothetical protein